MGSNDIAQSTRRLIRLECTEGNSNKYYKIKVETASGPGYTVTAFYGRIGQTGQQSQVKTKHGPVREREAFRLANDLARKKQRKGYVMIQDSIYDVHAMAPAPPRARYQSAELVGPEVGEGLFSVGL